MSHFGRPDSKRRRVGTPFLAWPQVFRSLQTEAAAVTRGEGGSELRSALSPCLRVPQPSKRFCQSCINAFARSERHKMRENPIFRSLPGDPPPHDEPFWATRQQATKRGEALSRRPLFWATRQQATTRGGAWLQIFFRSPQSPGERQEGHQ